MEAILRVALSNTVLAAMLALAALAVSRTFRRPAVSHALWLIVLLKLITPPLWNVALPLIPAEKKAPLPPTELSMPPVESEPGITFAEADEAQRWAVPTLQTPEIDGWHGQRYSDAGGSGTLARHPQHGHASTPAHATQLTVSRALLMAWTAGSGFSVLIIAFRVCQFTRLLRFAQSADAHVQMLARALTSRVGMKSTPRVWFVPGPLCPMLWAFGGKAKLLIPAGLWDRLDDAQRSTLLLHELAHYRRGDHWIRGLELLVTIVFWWNPIAWWARHELREAEEQCCDAWVIWTLPGAARDYAIALMEAIDFVSSSRSAVPVLASPMGEFHDLKRRLLMIKQHAAPRALGWTGFSLVCLLAALLLPLSGTLAQQLDRPTPAGLPPTGPATELPVGETQPPVAPEPAPALQDNFADFTLALVTDADPNAAAQQEAQALEEELKKTSAQIAALTTRLKAAQARLTQIHNAMAKTGAVIGEVPAADPLAGRTPTALTRTRTRALLPANANGTVVMPNNADQERRLRTVEQKLDLLIAELREMRQDRPDAPRQPQPETAPGGYRGGLQKR